MAETEEVRELVVYWRPGCPYCRRLLGALERAGVRTRLENIWELDEARRFVTEHNDGDETVPTVSLGDRVLTNPDPQALISAIASDFPDLLDPPVP